MYNEPTIVRGRLRTRISLQYRSVTRLDSNFGISLDAQFKIRISELVLKLHALTSILSVF